MIEMTVATSFCILSRPNALSNYSNLVGRLR